MKKDIFNNYKVKLIIFLCIVFLCTILAEFLRFTKPLFDRIYYGYLTPMIIDALRIIIYFLIFALKTFFNNSSVYRIIKKEMSILTTPATILARLLYK